MFMEAAASFSWILTIIASIHKYKVRVKYRVYFCAAILWSRVDYIILQDFFKIILNQGFYFWMLKNVSNQILLARQFSEIIEV